MVFHILIRSDSTNAVSYIQNMGGMGNSKMNALAIDIWQFAIDNNLWLSASFIPGRDNTDADTGSRLLNVRTEWSLPVPLFDAICSRLFTPTIDLFASRLNAKLDKYFSWTPDPYCTNVDAFLCDWSNEYPFLFPPFALLGRALRKITADRVTKAVVVFPLWPSQHWFPRLLQMLTSPIYLLPEHPAIFLPWETIPTPHPLQSSLLLAAAQISSLPQNFNTCPQTSRKLSDMGSEKLPKRLTRKWIGSGIYLQVQNRSIHICPL